MTKEFLLIRHSERIDEVDMPAWASMVENDKSGRDMISVSNDPPITANGAELAKRAAISVRSLGLIESAQREGKTITIYSSRLIRCVQTAYEIAVLLGLPIHISSGLSLTAIAVIKAKGSFEFQSLESLRAACPGVELIDCDDNTIPERFVPNKHWQGAIERIVDRGEVNILVVHRETIRNFCGHRLRTPYCCLGLATFHDPRGKQGHASKSRQPQQHQHGHPHSSSSSSSSGSGSSSDPIFFLRSVHDHTGQVVEQLTKAHNVVHSLVDLN